ncbi:MAG: metallophosphoesterase [Armatimonadetes bacterium]|nr:metallophosphoesterase [Armatimonadota bacterium]
MKAATDPTRRKLLRRVLLRGGAVGVAGLWGYAGLWEPNHPVVETVSVTLPNLPPAFHGVRVAFLSDLHLQPAFRAERLAPTLALLTSAKPDAVLLGGDYCNGTLGDREYWLEECANAFRAVSVPLGIFAVFGNHDYPVSPFDPPRRPWRDAGIVPLHDEVAELTRGGERVFVVGLRSTLMRPSRMYQLSLTLPTGATKIVCQHEPMFVPHIAGCGGSVMLSGHTHGGQIVLPFVGAPVLPPYSNGYRAGLYRRESEMPLYVTRGVGVLPPLLRFRCAPEVTILTLLRGDA